MDTHDLNPGKLSIELYPIFTEARWFKFVTGRAHNGATYVGDKYLYTSSDASRYFLTDFAVPARTGYRFKGWYADAHETDGNGDYIDGQQITDENGRIVNIRYTKYASDGLTPLYEVADGRIYVYKDVDATAGVTLYAHWEEITETNIQVIVWTQKISDSKNAPDYQKTYDFEAAYTLRTDSGMTLNDLLVNGVLHAEVKERNEDGTVTSRGDLDLDPNNQSDPVLTDFSKTGFHFRTTEMSTNRVRSDGSTVVNIYYDRDLMTIYFYYKST